MPEPALRLILRAVKVNDFRFGANRFLKIPPVVSAPE